MQAASVYEDNSELRRALCTRRGRGIFRGASLGAIARHADRIDASCAGTGYLKFLAHRDGDACEAPEEVAAAQTIVDALHADPRLIATEGLEGELLELAQMARVVARARTGAKA